MQMQMQMQVPMQSMRQYDSVAETQLDQWLDAKHQKDFGTADAIREQLRSRGISPSKERPLNGGAQDELVRWRAAKQNKDWSRSDRIRDSLRSQGMDPDKMGAANVPQFSAMPQVAPPGGMWVQAPAWKPQQQMGSQQRGQQQSKPREPNIARMDPGTIDELAQWFEARENKDWNTADSLRDRLRGKGIEPADCQKPHTSSLNDGHTEELRQWFEAREQKDFAVADEIRERLRAQGVEPSGCPDPRGGGGGGGYGKAASHGGAPRSMPYSAAGGGGGHDFATETQLDEWFKCKQDKNFNAADAIRAELRLQGIEPDQHRPKR